MIKMFKRICSKSDIIYQVISLLYLLLFGIYIFTITRKITYGYDEAYTVAMISRPFREIISVTSLDVHPPLYYFLVRLFSLIPGIGFLRGPRIFSFVCGELFLIFSYFAVKKRYGVKAALIFLPVSTLSPIFINQITNARMYTLALLLVTIFIIFSFDLIEEKITPFTFIIMTLSAILSFYTHVVCMTGVTILYLIFIIMCLLLKKIKEMKSFIISALFSLLAFVPWTGVILRQYSSRTSEDSHHSLTDSEWLKEVFTAIRNELFSFEEYVNLSAIYFGMAFAALSIIICLVISIKKKDYLPLISIITPLIVLMTVGIFLLITTGQFAARYLFPFLYGLWICESLLLSKMILDPISFKNRPIISLLLNAAGLCLSLMLCHFGHWAYDQKKIVLDETGIQTYREIVSDRLQPDVAIMASDQWSLLLSVYTPETEYMKYGYMPEGLPFNVPEDKIYTRSEQLDDYDTIYLVGNSNTSLVTLSDERFRIIEWYDFRHYMYEFKIARYIRISQ